jgi:hypothetical protein
MAKDDPHFRLRIPPQLKEAIEEAARDDKRSLNMEIVQRLYLSFDAEEEIRDLKNRLSAQEALTESLREQNRHIRHINEAYEQQNLDSARQAAGWEEWAARVVTEENTAYIVLDGDGAPQCWDEAMVHLGAIREALGDSVERIDASFVDTKKEPGERRVKQLAKLVDFYRSRRNISQES